jgi:hypothetical protein
MKNNYEINQLQIIDEFQCYRKRIDITLHFYIDRVDLLVIPIFENVIYNKLDSLNLNLNDIMEESLIGLS